MTISLEIKYEFCNDYVETQKQYFCNKCSKWKKYCRYIPPTLEMYYLTDYPSGFYLCTPCRRKYKKICKEQE